jgi:hypothetical protein
MTARVCVSSWAYSRYLVSQWTTLGGDYTTTPSASVTVTGPGVVEVSSAGLLADVSAWIANGGSNNGWLLRTDESAADATLVRD